MATILRDWSYRYQWLYDAIAQLATVSVGGESRFRQLAFQGLPIGPETKVLDLCCGSGQTTQFLVQRSNLVTGLDASPRALIGQNKMYRKLTMLKPLQKRCPF